MGSTIHALDLSASPAAVAAVNVVFGDDAYLKQLTVAELRRRVLQDAETPYADLAGDKAEWRDVHDELSTMSLFGGSGPRLVILQGADPFVTKNRDRLLAYVAQPTSHAALILEVSKWASNTKLYKQVAQTGLQVECRAPVKNPGSRFPNIDKDRIVQWLIARATEYHHVKLLKGAAGELYELMGPEFGLLDQEIGRLALYTEPGGKITENLVREQGGGWQTKTIWQVMDAALDGNGPEALRQLDRLFASGQDPAALVGSIYWTLRRYAAATRVYEQAERQGQRIKLSSALQRAKLRDNDERRLRRLTRPRAGKFYRWSLETDLALKGSHSSPTLARLALEQLVLRIAAP